MASTNDSLAGKEGDNVSRSGCLLHSQWREVVSIAAHMVNSCMPRSWNRTATPQRAHPLRHSCGALLRLTPAASLCFTASLTSAVCVLKTAQDEHGRKVQPHGLSLIGMTAGKRRNSSQSSHWCQGCGCYACHCSPGKTEVKFDILQR